MQFPNNVKSECDEEDAMQSESDDFTHGLRDKSLGELIQIRATLRTSTLEWSESLGALARSIANQRIEIDNLVASAQRLDAERRPLAKKLEDAIRNRDIIKEKIEELQKQMNDAEEHVSKFKVEHKKVDAEISRLVSESETKGAVVTQESKLLPKAIASQEKLHRALQEVDLLIKEKTGTIQLSASELLGKQMALLSSLKTGKVVDPVGDCVSQAPQPTNSVNEHAPELGYQSASEDKESDSETILDSPSGPRVKRRQEVDPIRDLFFAHAAEIRKIFKDQHSRKRTGSQLLLCQKRSNGVWVVTNEQRLEHNISGCQGTRTNVQGFNVRLRNQIISQKVLDHGLDEHEERIPVTFEDPRDATEVYRALCRLFASRTTVTMI